jgi:CubicO group peptidase (beta-lactamase class C family)
MEKIAAEKLASIPGTQFLYSDLNFMILGELVSRASGQPLDAYCAQHLFAPLGMRDTGFRLPESQHPRLAHTQYKKRDSGKKLWAEVHDLTALMGGAAVTPAFSPRATTPALLRHLDKQPGGEY